MPFINIQLMQGRTLNQKRNLVDKVTKAVCETIDVAPEKVRIVLSEMTKEDCAIAGKLAIDNNK